MPDLAKSLQAIMTEYRYGEDAFIPPTQLRRALSVLYKDLERFQLGKIVRDHRIATLTCDSHPTGRRIRGPRTDQPRGLARLSADAFVGGAARVHS